MGWGAVGNSRPSASSATSRRDRARPDSQRDALVLAHIDLVRKIAYHLLVRMPATVDVDDLIQSGMLGLIAAARDFSPDRGAAFASYAGIRIRGAMLDEARRADWVPRSVRRGLRNMQEAARRLQRETGLEARPAQVAQALGLSLESYHRLVNDSVACRPLSYEQVFAMQEQNTPDAPDESGRSPDEDLENDEFHAALTAAIEDLPERLKQVLSLYFDDELNLREVGAVLGVTESRVCQLHAQARAEIRIRMKAWTNAS
jgi:RNA polymerase sigma factor for flagellar operon FliA